MLPSSINPENVVLFINSEDYGEMIYRIDKINKNRERSRTKWREKNTNSRHLNIKDHTITIYVLTPISSDDKIQCTGLNICNKKLPEHDMNLLDKIKPTPITLI